MFNSDPYYYSTKNHFRRMIKEYGKDIYMINLVKRGEKYPGETSLADEYKKAVSFINKDLAE